MPRLFVLSLALLLAPASAFAADRHTCKVLVKLIEATDRGLEGAATGKAKRQPASGIATYAETAQDMADQFSTKDPLPAKVVAALSAMAKAATANYSIAESAPALLQQGLIIQQAMPQICPGSKVPNLSRHH